MSSMAVVTVHPRALARRRAGHLWVYASDVLDPGQAASGDIVRVVDARGKQMGFALYSPSSRIALRFVADASETPEREFWRQRLLAAAAYRHDVVEDTEAYRLVFGESDRLPSLIIDRYGDTFVVQTLTPGMERLKGMWVDLLRELYAPRAIVERNDVKARTLEGLPLQKGLLDGSLGEPVRIRMNDVIFEVDIINGQKTGAFLDQRENYRAAARYARGRCLDGFCFSGGFALHLARRADSVLAVDISPEALAAGRRNAELNGLSNITFVEANLFDYLRELDKKRETFDLIVLDPPAFAKSRAALEGALRGYKEINLRALRLLRPGGILVTCSCSYHVSEEMLLAVLQQAAADAGRSCRVLERRTQARDHPVLLAMPETYYLKCVILHVVH